MTKPAAGDDVRESRRAFLAKSLKTAGYVAPAMMVMSMKSLAVAQSPPGKKGGGGGGGGKGKGP